MLPHGGFKNKSYFQMPKLIQILGSVIVVFFHSLPIVVSAVIYIALLITVKKIKQEKEHQIQVEKVISEVSKEFSNSAKSNFKVKENTVMDQSIENIESSIQNSDEDCGKVITDQHQLSINSISCQNIQNMKSVQTRVICIDSDFLKKKDNSLNSSHSSTTHGTSRQNSSSFNLENAKSNTKSHGNTPKKKGKEEIERIAALRSMKTNLLMLLLFLIYGLFTFVPTMKWKMFLFILFESFLKCLMPIVTTLSNFGPVKRVAKIYFNLIKYHLPDVSNN